jgi:hypothetical protein
MKIAIINKSDLSIATQYEGILDQSKFGGPWGQSSQTAHLEIPNNLDSECIKAELDGNGAIVIVADAALASSKLQAQRESKLSLMRSQRDAKLGEVDIMVNELVLSIRSDNAAVSTYRSDLKNITNSYKSGNAASAACDALSADLSNLSWPTAP